MILQQPLLAEADNTCSDAEYTEINNLDANYSQKNRDLPRNEERQNPNLDHNSKIQETPKRIVVRYIIYLLLGHADIKTEKTIDMETHKFQKSNSSFRSIEASGSRNKYQNNQNQTNVESYSNSTIQSQPNLPNLSTATNSVDVSKGVKIFYFKGSDVLCGQCDDSSANNNVSKYYNGHSEEKFPDNTILSAYRHMKEQRLISKDIPFAYTLRSIRDDYFLLFYIIANIINEYIEIKNESFQEEGSIHLHAYQKLYYFIKFRNYQCLILRDKPSLFQKENITPLCYSYIKFKKWIYEIYKLKKVKLEYGNSELNDNYVKEESRINPESSVMI